MNSADRRAQLIARIRAYPGTFLHTVPLDDPVATHTLSVSGRLFASEYASLDAGLWEAHTSIRDTPINQVAKSPPVGTPTPFAAWRVWAAAVIRNGGHVAVNALAPVWLSQADEQGLLHAGDVELAFERARRAINDDAASRLTSLYVADDTPEGRRHLEAMFRGKVDRQVFRVTIP
jgi:hypothetical protein